MRKHSGYPIFVVSFSLIFFASASLLLAQEGIGNKKQVGDSQKITTLEEVTVKAAPPARNASTGTKTDTPLQNVPANIAVIPRSIIETQGGTGNLDYAIQNVSGVSQSSGSNYGFFNNYLIRGLSMNFLRDGVPDASTINGYSRSLADVEKIEVLKGPGSALYGSGAGGGSINLISKKPLDTAQYSLTGSYGAFDTYETAADLTGPLIPDRLTYRFIANYYNAEGFRNVGKENFEILPTMKLKLAENHEITFDFDYRDIEVLADTYGTPFQGTSTTQRNSLLGVPRTHKYYTPFATTDQRILRYAVLDEIRFTDKFLLRNNFVVLDRNLYLLRNAGGTIAAGSRVMTGRNLREQTDNVTDYLYQIEPVIDFETWKIAHKLLTGFEFQYRDVHASRSTASLSNITDVFNPVIPETNKDALRFTPNFDRDIDAYYLSWYAQDQIDLTEQLKLRLGGRIDRFHTGIKSHLDRTSLRRQDHPFSGQIGLLYRPIDQTSFYGGISSSKQAILSTESTSLNRPEGAVQYEIGNKTSFFNEKLNFDVSWFYVTRKDFLVTIGTETLPVGEQKTQGVDIDAWFEPLQGWRVYANYSFQDARLVNVPVSSGPSVNGNRPTGVPVNLVNFWTTYEVPKGPLKGLGMGSGFTYKDSVFLNQQNTSLIPSYMTADLVLFYRKKWFEFQVNMKNLTDAVWYRNGVNSGALPGDSFGVYGTIRLRYPDPEKARSIY